MPRKQRGPDGRSLLAMLWNTLGLRFVPHQPWDGDYACGCGAPSTPCPICSSSDSVEPPMMKPYFIEDAGE